MLSHHNPAETEIPRQINASVLPPPISPLRMQRERCAFFVGGDGEIARDGEAGAGLVRDRRRGRMKGARLGRKQGVLEARSRAPQNDYVFDRVKKGEAFRLFIIQHFLLRVKYTTIQQKTVPHDTVFSIFAFLLNLSRISFSFGVLYLKAKVGRMLRYTFTIATGMATVKTGSPVSVSIARKPAG